MKRVAPMVIAVMVALAGSTDVSAVALKLMNDTARSWRARAYTADGWTTWREYNSGGWGDFATNVERAFHRVEVQVKGQDGSWYTEFSGLVDARRFTRIAQVVDTNGGREYSLMWWDERGGGCRDMPPLLPSRPQSCLDLSSGP